MRRLLGTVGALARQACSQLSEQARQLADWGRRTWQRHLYRLHHDPTYRSAVVTGVAAVITAVLPSPTLAAAFARLVEDLIPDPRPRPWSDPEPPWGPAASY